VILFSRKRNRVRMARITNRRSNRMKPNLTCGMIGYSPLSYAICVGVYNKMNFRIRMSYVTPIKADLLLF